MHLSQLPNYISYVYPPLHRARASPSSLPYLCFICRLCGRARFLVYLDSDDEVVGGDSADPWRARLDTVYNAITRQARERGC